MASVALTESFIEGVAPQKRQEEFYDSTFNYGASFGLRLGQGGRKSFFLIYRAAGKRKRLTLGLYPIVNLETARREAVSLLTRLQEGRDPAEEWRKQTRILSFKNLSQEFLLYHVQKLCRGKTRNEYQRIIAKELLPIWAELDLRDLTTQEIESVILQIANTRKRPVLANRVRALLHKMFGYFAACSYINSNPISSTSLIAVPPKEGRILGDEELRRFWRVLEGATTPAANVLKMLLLTGQSLSHVCTMRWRDIHGDLWLVEPSKIIPERIHLVSLSPQAQLLLATISRGMNIARKTGEYVFPSESDTPIGNVRAILRRFCEKCGILPSISSKDLCLTVECNLRKQGVGRDVIAYLFNRKTAFIYAHRRESKTGDFDEAARAALSIWGRKLFEIVEPAPPQQADDKVVSLFSKRKV